MRLTPPPPLPPSMVAWMAACRSRRSASLMSFTDLRGESADDPPKLAGHCLVAWQGHGRGRALAWCAAPHACKDVLGHRIAHFFRCRTLLLLSPSIPSPPSAPAGQHAAQQVVRRLVAHVGNVVAAALGAQTLSRDYAKCRQEAAANALSFCAPTCTSRTHAHHRVSSHLYPSV